MTTAAPSAWWMRSTSQVSQATLGSPSPGGVQPGGNCHKADLVTEEQLAQVEQSVREINPKVALYRTTYANVSLREILSEGPQEEAAPQESSNTESSRPVTITLSTQEAISPKPSGSSLDEIAPSTYRVKGFCRTTEGTKNVSMVGTVCQIEDWGDALGETQLVIISNVGVRIFSVTLAAADHYFQSPRRPAVTYFPFHDKRLPVQNSLWLGRPFFSVVIPLFHACLFAKSKGKPSHDKKYTHLCARMNPSGREIL